ncbi:GNAT family N-acetyltransferase [Candidatus Poribacteria bacterium]|nr:GNAT family N-acetyltransferase [Candidatus Poribacteria bacterium]
MEQEFEIKAILRIRRPTMEDAPALHTYCFPSLKAKDVEEKLRSDLEDMEGGKVIRLVADAGGYAIGNIKLTLDEENPSVGRVSDVVVAGPFKGINVADKLMQVLSDVAKSKGVKTLEVQVHRSETRVIEAFKKWGFSEREIITLEKHLD